MDYFGGIRKKGNTLELIFEKGDLAGKEYNIKVPAGYKLDGFTLRPDKEYIPETWEDVSRVMCDNKPLYRETYSRTDALSRLLFAYNTYREMCSGSDSYSIHLHPVKTSINLPDIILNFSRKEMRDKFAACFQDIINEYVGDCTNDCCP